MGTTLRRSSGRSDARYRHCSVRAGEDPEVFWNEVAVWVQERGAVTADEIACIETAVYSRWTRRRAQNAQAYAITEIIDQVNHEFSPDGEKRTRHIAMSDRTMISHLKMVLVLKKDRLESGDPDPEVADWTPEDEPAPAVQPEAEPESEPAQDETPAPAEPAESNQAHQNGAAAPVAEEPVSEAARGANFEAQSNPVTTQTVGQASDNTAPAPHPAAGSGSLVEFSEADHEATRALYRRTLDRLEVKLKECSENEAFETVPDASA